MLVDGLHQLLKGLVMYIIVWLTNIIKDEIPTAQKRKGWSGTWEEIGGKAQLN
jgi:hypothetical protein